MSTGAGVRPADGARAELAARRAERGGAKGGSARPTAPSPAPAVAAEPPPVAPGAAPPEDRAAPVSLATPAPGPGAPTSGDAGIGDVGSLTALWNDVVLASLSGLTKAMYAAGRFTAVDGSAVTFAVPNEVHRQKCEQKRSEVESALSDRVGRPVRLTLVVDGPGVGPSGSSPTSSGPIDEPDDDPDDIGDLGAVHDLPDAPAGASGGLDALTEAFPGAELIEDP